MLVVFDVRKASPEETVAILGGLLDALVIQNLILAKQLGRMPDPYTTGVRYRPEPQAGLGIERFDNFLVCIKRKWADCDDFCGWRVAQLQWHGESATCRVLWPQGTRRYHAQIRRGDGSIEDVSQAAMRKERHGNG